MQCHFSRKRLEKWKISKIGHSEWKTIGKVANSIELAILSYSELLWWEKIGKVAKQAKLAILSHSASLWCEKIVLKMIKID